MKKGLLYRFSQLVSLLLGARFFVLLFFAFTLYVSTYFLFNQEDSLKTFVFDYKVNGIILCSLVSIAAGGIINQFYDKEKDYYQKPFRAKLQQFLQQKYFLYTYIIGNVFSLSLAFILSFRIFIFFLLYQFLMWFYSHKMSKLLIINNISFVILILYPFFGMLVYYQHFSWFIFYMSAFLFLTLCVIDIIKDILTLKVDQLFGYNTIPIFFGYKISTIIINILFIINILVSYLIIDEIGSFNLLQLYFICSICFFIICIITNIYIKRVKMYWMMNLLRLWVLLGVCSMLLNGIIE